MPSISAAASRGVRLGSETPIEPSAPQDAAPDLRADALDRFREPLADLLRPFVESDEHALGFADNLLDRTHPPELDLQGLGKFAEVLKSDEVADLLASFCAELGGELKTVVSDDGDVLSGLTDMLNRSGIDRLELHDPAPLVDLRGFARRAEGHVELHGGVGEKSVVQLNTNVTASCKSTLEIPIGVRLHKVTVSYFDPVHLSPLGEMAVAGMPYVRDSRDASPTQFEAAATDTNLKAKFAAGGTIACRHYSTSVAEQVIRADKEKDAWIARGRDRATKPPRLSLARFATLGEVARTVAPSTPKVFRHIMFSRPPEVLVEHHLLPAAIQHLRETADPNAREYFLVLTRGHAFFLAAHSKPNPRLAQGTQHVGRHYEPGNSPVWVRHTGESPEQFAAGFRRALGERKARTGVSLRDDGGPKPIYRICRVGIDDNGVLSPVAPPTGRQPVDFVKPATADQPEEFSAYLVALCVANRGAELEAALADITSAQLDRAMAGTDGDRLEDLCHCYGSDEAYAALLRAMDRHLPGDRPPMSPETQRASVDRLRSNHKVASAGRYLEAQLAVAEDASRAAAARVERSAQLMDQLNSERSELQAQLAEVRAARLATAAGATTTDP